MLLVLWENQQRKEGRTEDHPEGLGRIKIKSKTIYIHEIFN